MKRILKLTLAAVFVMAISATAASAQKFGFMNTGDLIPAMPEMDSVRTKLQAYEAELNDMLESIQVEFNQKFNDYQKGYETMTDAVRQMRERELQSLRERFEEFQQSAQIDMQNMQNQLMLPIIERAREAIERLGRQNNLTGIFDLAAGALAYHDESQMMDITPMLKAELGIRD